MGVTKDNPKYRHRIVAIEEFAPDHQTTVWILWCGDCGKPSQPLVGKGQVQAAYDAKSCPGVPVELEQRIEVAAAIEEARKRIGES